MNLSVPSRDVEVDVRRSFRERGFQIAPKVISDVECDALATELAGLFERQQNVSRRRIGGVRNLLRNSPSVRSLAVSAPVISLVSELMAAEALPVRAIFFDKTPETNWSVPWHQDLAIAVAERIDTPGFSPWSVKDGIVHVQPPCEILSEMLALRIHLDDYDADNGALKIIPGSHQQGELSNEAIREWASDGEAIVCEVKRGGALAMRPLLLHSSTAADCPTHRRVLHIEYAAGELPNGLRWAEQ